MNVEDQGATRPRERFSDRVHNYVSYRPGYPTAIVDLLRSRCGLDSRAIVADIGSGTGLLSRLFLDHGNRLYGVEPNREMREACERLLASFPAFISVDGTAESTTLASSSIDFMTAGQAFHWFDAERTRAEFARILRPSGWVVLVWNDRRTSSTPFLVAYEELLQSHGTDYRAVDHKRIDRAVIETFYRPGQVWVDVFENRQVFDYEGLKGRLLSSSYAPGPGDPGHLPMMDALKKLFDAHQRDGHVSFDYDTRVYFGRLD